MINSIIEDCIFAFSFDDNSVEDSSVFNNKNASLETTNNTIELNISSEYTKTNAVSISSSNYNTSLNDKDKLIDNRKSLVSNGMAPPIDGEYLDVKRTYILRASTVRNINELKSIHPKLNTYVSTIVNMAIAYYHNHVINEGGKQ